MTKPRAFAIAVAAFLGLSLTPPAVHAAPKDHFKVCWTIYAGWMPWEYAGT
nr:lipid kinase [Zoogloeaceae bacterium]